MPGNKNSGRKRKIDEDDANSVRLESTLPKNILPRGRPSKTNKNNINIKKVEEDTIASSMLQSSLARTSSNVTKLSVRNSDINKFYDTYLGAALDRFQLKTLPLNKTTHSPKISLSPIF